MEILKNVGCEAFLMIAIGQKLQTEIWPILTFVQFLGFFGHKIHILREIDL